MLQLVQLGRGRWLHLEVGGHGGLEVLLVLLVHLGAGLGLLGADRLKVAHRLQLLFPARIFLAFIRWLDGFEL